MIKVSDYVINFLVKCGIKHIFLLPGGGCMHLVDSVGRNENLEYVCCLHEQAVGIAADGYAQYRGGLGVGLVTTGPGGTNAITGVVGSWIDSVPVLMISGQVKRQDLMKGKRVRQHGIQEVDIVSLVSPITKYAVTVMEPESIRYHLEKAVHIATTGRPGPVWLDIPLDIQGAYVLEENLTTYAPHSDENKKNRDKTFQIAISKVLTGLANAKRPVLLAGNGIRLAGAVSAFEELVSILKIPVLTTWRFADAIEEEHPYFFGRPGSIATRYANFVLQNSDFLLSIGARLDLAQIGYYPERFAPKAFKVIVDIDEGEIEKLYNTIQLPVIADAKLFILKILEQINIKNNINTTKKEWIEQCKNWKQQYSLEKEAHCSTATNGINTYTLIKALSKLLHSNDIIVPGSSGSCAEITLQAFQIKRGQRLINSPGLGAMGFGLPQSIGVCLASGRRRTVVILGDGGLQHNIQELETVHRLNLPIKLFVLNNNGYAAIRNTHRRFFDGRLVCCDAASGLTLPDTLKLAEAYGLKTCKIDDQQLLEEKIAWVLNEPGPVVCELMIDPDLQIAPRLASKMLPDGRMESAGLEELWPFRDQFK